MSAPPRRDFALPGGGDAVIPRAIIRDSHFSISASRKCRKRPPNKTGSGNPSREIRRKSHIRLTPPKRAQTWRAVKNSGDSVRITQLQFVIWSCQLFTYFDAKKPTFNVASNRKSHWEMGISSISNFLSENSQCRVLMLPRIRSLESGSPDHITQGSRITDRRSDRRGRLLGRRERRIGYGYSNEKFSYLNLKSARPPILPASLFPARKDPSPIRFEKFFYFGAGV